MTRLRCHGRCCPRAGRPRTTVPSRARSRWVSLALALLALGCALPGDPPAPAEQKSSLVDVNWENDVEIEVLQSSVHSKLDCPDCHANFEARRLDAKKPQAEKLCRGCHREADAAFDVSVHGAQGKADKKEGARCQDCHGAHDVRAIKDKQSKVSKRNVVKTCVKCHENPLYDSQLDPDQKELVGQYTESIHGRELLQKGMLKAPSCADCHGGGHDVQKVLDANSNAQKTAVMEMCNSCHSGITKTYAASVHGQALAKGEKDAPTCASCHSAHGVRERALGFRMTSDEQCGSCHEERFGAHLQTYHGRAHALGGAQVATCFDCHGHHEVLPSSNPASLVSKERKLETCQKCHKDAPANLAGYKPHGDPKDRAHFPTLFWSDKSMTWLIRGALALFVLHTVGWVLRSIVDFVRDPGAFREARRRRYLAARRQYAPPFRGIDRFCYALLLLSFVLLLGTGLPLEYSQTGWAKSLFGLLGGADGARSLHHLGAGLTVAYAALHLASLVAAFWGARDDMRDAAGRFRWALLWRFAFGPESPLPNWRDVKSVWAHAKWLAGRGPEPAFERYRYWEKLDYLALFFGIAVIGCSGFVMWAPELALRILPGYVVNIAQIIHHEQALLVLASILTVHVCHLLPRFFPPGLPARSRPRRAPALARSRVVPAE